MKNIAKIAAFIIATLLGTAMMVFAQPEIYYIPLQPLQYFSYD